MEQKKFIQTQPTGNTLFTWLYRLLCLQFILFVSCYILRIIFSIITTYLQSDSSFSPFIFTGCWFIIAFFLFIKFVKISPVSGDLSLEFEENELKLLGNGDELLIPYRDMTSIVVSVSNKAVTILLNFKQPRKPSHLPPL